MSCFGFDPRRVCRVGDGNCLGVSVLGMMLLSMDLFMFLQILRTFEGLATDLAIMGFEWRMNCQANRISQDSSKETSEKMAPRRWLVM